MRTAKKVTHIPVRRTSQTQPSDQPPASPPSSSSLAPPLPSEFSAQEGPAVDWRDMALRLRADMENYRKRQLRLAEDRIIREKYALLVEFLGVVDNLEQVLSHLKGEDAVHQGIKLTYDAALSLLRAEGVETIKAQGEVFDPTWHEAIAVLPTSTEHVSEEDTMRVVEVEQTGYRIGDKVLRPARVIVARKE
ncbi:MAG: nucleotide exchange factor GrpE [Anaerolineae bacterium]|nr:nucleotide exchange factor GrpE [Anaerolineae bacterium]